MPQEKLNPDQWVDLYADYLFAFARQKVRDPEQCKDLVSETLLSALKAQDQFRGEASEKTWLTRILHFKIIDYYRKSGKSTQNLDEYLAQTENAFYDSFFDTSHGDHWHKNKRPNAQNGFTSFLADSFDFQEVLNFCLEKLPTRMRTIFVSKYLEDEDSEVICKENEISSSNYWVLIHRAKLVMRACLEKQWL